MYECDQSTPSMRVGYSLMGTPCECVCVVKYEFVLGE